MPTSTDYLGEIYDGEERSVEKGDQLKQDDLIVVTGAGGFIDGHVAFSFRKKIHQHPTHSKKS